MNIELYLFLLHRSKLLQPCSIFVLLIVVFWNTEILYVTPQHRVEQYNYYIGFKFVYWHAQQRAHPHFYTCLSPMVITSLPFSVGPICCSITLTILIWKKKVNFNFFCMVGGEFYFRKKRLACLDFSSRAWASSIFHSERNLPLQTGSRDQACQIPAAEVNMKDPWLLSLESIPGCSS